MYYFCFWATFYAMFVESAPEPFSNVRITDANEERITDAGDRRVTDN